MALVFVRPSIQHKAANVLSSTSSTGLTVQEPTPTAGNAGNLRLRCSGTPTAVVGETIKLKTGGAPTGYTVPGVEGRGTGVGVIRKTTGAADTLYKGYTDTPSLVRVVVPIAHAASMRPPSSPRQLPDGYLGVLISTASDSHSFYRIATDWSVSSVVVSTEKMIGSACRSDFVVLPSGRLVAYLGDGTLFAYYSDDNGSTWAALGETVVSSRDVTSAEVIGDQIVVIRSDSAGASVSEVLLSTDGGATFNLMDDSATLIAARTCVHGGQVVVGGRVATNYWVRPVAPGGRFGAAVQTATGANGAGCVVARDDGTLWAFGWQATLSELNMDASVSVDGGLTWLDPADGDPVMDLEYTGYGAAGYDSLSGGMWHGAMIVIGKVTSNGATDDALHFLQFGEWANLTHGNGNPSDPTVFKHTYTAIDLPQNLGWTRSIVGAGATETYPGFLKIVGTTANNSSWASSAAWEESRRLTRLRFRVNSGGSLTANVARLRIVQDDGGGNMQGVTLRFSTTGIRALGEDGVQLGSDLVVSLTGWCDLVVAFGWDYPETGGAGVVSVYYKLDSASSYTEWLSGEVLVEVAGADDRTYFGGTSVAAAVNWDIAYLGAAFEDGNLMTGYTVPDDLTPRPLSASYDVQLTSGINLGAYGNGGVPGDTYTLATRYTYGPERVWSDLRPSSRTQSLQDNVTWSVTFDAGATALFRGNFAAAFGTNMKTARWQMNATDSWGSPSVDAALDATLSTFTVGAGVRGVGYLGPTVSPIWRAHQWRSNGDSRRFFIEVNSVSYEITDNDEDRIYVDGVDFGAAGVNASGTATLYGDRMAGTFTFGLYRYARFAVTSGQQTADDVYRLGTPIVGKQWTPNQIYDNGFVDRIEPNVTTTDAENGSSISYRRGPAIDTLSIQWPPLDRLRADVEIRLRDFYRSIDGALTPVVLWRDTSSLATLSLVQVREVYSATNVLGELDNAVTRIDQLVLREVW